MAEQAAASPYTPEEQRILDTAMNLYMVGIKEGRMQEALDNNLGDRYTQHSTGVKDGKEGFMEFFAPFLERNPEREFTPVQSVAEGSHCMVQMYQNLNNGAAQWVTMDIFDTDENGKIVEHWDVIVPYAGENQIVSPSEVKDVELTEANKARVRLFLVDCFQNGNADAVTTYINAENYVDHSPSMNDVDNVVESIVASVREKTRVYSFVFKTFGKGDRIVAMSKVVISGVENCVMEVFRLEAGMIVERWESAEQIAPRDQWGNGGKF